MDSTHILLIQQSYAQLAPDAEPLADLFYARLFQLDPTLRRLFIKDLRVQKRLLIQMLDRLVRDLEQPAQWLPVIEALGRRHRDYGVTAAHYETFGSALIWTLEKGLGEGFTFDILSAWVGFYQRIAMTMQAASQSVSSQQSVSHHAGGSFQTAAQPAN